MTLVVVAVVAQAYAQGMTVTAMTAAAVDDVLAEHGRRSDTDPLGRARRPPSSIPRSSWRSWPRHRAPPLTDPPITSRQTLHRPDDGWTAAEAWFDDPRVGYQDGGTRARRRVREGAGAPSPVQIAERAADLSPPPPTRGFLAARFVLSQIEMGAKQFTDLVVRGNTSRRTRSPLAGRRSCARGRRS